MPDTTMLLIVIIALLIVLIGLCFYIIKITKNGSGADMKELFKDIATKDDIRQLLDDNNRIRAALDRQSKENREETNTRLDGIRTSLSDSFLKFNESQANQWNSMGQRIDEMSKTNASRLDGIRLTVDAKLKDIQSGNEKKLDEMRGVVDEKLNKTLNERFSQSFKQVLDELEKVYKSLGEVNSLSKDMGDIKNIFKNVKTRGTWGEMQLASLLEQMLTKEQYDSNVKLRTNSDENVEFAIKLPGPDDTNKVVYLPIDSKFPMEDYIRLLDAVEKSDIDALDKASKALETRVLKQAKDIRDKYINPPNTTDFAILFLPVESLFAEILRRPGLCERLQQDYHVTVAGPTTLAALLNSLQMGFRTLAIQKSSGEVWKLLGAVKKQFGTFSDTLSKVERHLENATKGVQDATQRTAIISKRLDKVQELDIHDAQQMLPFEINGLEDTEIFVSEQE